MSNLEASFSILGQKGVMAYILKGTVFTLIIALIAVVLGIWPCAETTAQAKRRKYLA